jgi:Lon protease-like protein
VIGRRPSTNPFDPPFEQLPEALPIFPLSGVLLLPGGRLPLNIFEPRYLAMFFDALGGHRMIGMLQPTMPGGFAGDGLPDDSGPPPVEGMGCAGRIVAFSETDDGRLLITLAGLIRFETGKELPLHAHGYRRVIPNYERFRSDLDGDDMAIELDRARLMTALEGFFRARKLQGDWSGLKRASDDNLVTSLAMVCPFAPSEKQALLEAPDGSARARLLIALLEMAAMGGGEPETPSRH